MFDISKITHQFKAQYKRFDKFILVNSLQAYERVWVQAPLTFQLGTIQRWKVKFTLHHFYLPGERAPGTMQIRGWLGSRGDLIFFFGKGEILPQFIKSNRVSQVVHRGVYTLYEIRFPWSLSVRNNSYNLTFNLLIYFDLFLGSVLPLTYGKTEIQREEKKLKLTE